MQKPGHDRHGQADREPLGAKETGGAAQRMAGLDRRGEHRATVLQQEGEVGGHRRSDGENQPDEHEKPGRRTTSGTSPAAEIARMAELREAVVDDVVELNENPNLKRRRLMCSDVLQPCYVCAARPAGRR